MVTGPVAFLVSGLIDVLALGVYLYRRRSRQVPIS